jgi:cysteine desulfurase
MIYLDNGATTPLCCGAKEQMATAISSFGNPSSLHFAGLEAKNLKEQTRRQLYSAVNARKEQYEIFFTSGGTEANNLAVFGVARAKNYKNPKIIITDSEHPCIAEPAKRLESDGFTVVRLSTVGGKINMDEFLAAMDERTILVSIMSVNNETGAIYPVKALFSAAKRINPSVICHTDAVQALTKIPLSPTLTGADMITVSAHKIHGPKGCGALLVHKELLKRRALLPLVCGGGQENGMRSGTENVIGIAGFGGALAENLPKMQENIEKMKELRAYLLEKLPCEITANLPENPAPHVLSITLPQIKSETALHALSAKGICVSNGSACSSNGGGHKNTVLSAFGLSEKQADSTLRVSFSAENTKEEVDALVLALEDCLKTLVRFK